MPGRVASDLDIRQQISTNLAGPVYTCRAAIPLLRAAGGGDIVNTSSESTLHPFPMLSMYVATKAALEAFALVLAQEVRDDEIRVTTVIQGGTNGTGGGSTDWEWDPEHGAAAMSLWTKTGLIAQAYGHNGGQDAESVGDVHVFVVTRPRNPEDGHGLLPQLLNRHIDDREQGGHMAGRLEGKVAFITGAARGQGRAHAIRMAQEGADIIAIDICAQIDSNNYPLGTPEDLAETERAVKELDRRIVARQADVRERSELRDALEAGIRDLGRLDIVVANAGILPMALGDPHASDFVDATDVDLLGVMNTVAIALPHLPDGASVIITGSTAGLMPGTTDNPVMGPGGDGYGWSKRTLVGYSEQMARHLAPGSSGSTPSTRLTATPTCFTTTASTRSSVPISRSPPRKTPSRPSTSSRRCPSPTSNPRTSPIWPCSWPVTSPATSPGSRSGSTGLAAEVSQRPGRLNRSKEDHNDECNRPRAVLRPVRLRDRH